MLELMLKRELEEILDWNEDIFHVRRKGILRGQQADSYTELCPSQTHVAVLIAFPQYVRRSLGNIVAFAIH